MNETTQQPRPADFHPERLQEERKKKLRSRTIWALALLVLVAIFGTLFYVAYLGRRPVELQLAKARLAILPFAASARPNDAWLGWGLSTVVAETLNQTPGMDVLPPDRLRQLLAQRGLDPANRETRATARQLAFAAGAGLVLDGEFRRREDGKVSLLFELIAPDQKAAHRGELQAKDALTLAAQLSESIARGMVPEIEGAQLETIFGTDPFFARLYGEGVQQLSAPGSASQKAAAARPYFEILLRNDPTFTRAKARLVDCLRDLGELDRARTMAEQLLQETLPRGELDLQVSSFRSLGMIDALQADEVAAAEQFRLAHRAALARQDKGGELMVLGDLVRLALAHSDRNKAEELLVEMVQVQKAQGDRLGEADSLLEIGSLYLAAGDFDGAAKVLEESQKLLKGANDLWGVQRISANLGEIAWRRGDVALAGDYWEKALEFYRKQKDELRILMMTRNLGEAQIRAGRYAQAEKLVIDLRELAKARGDHRTEAEACVSQAWLQLRLGYPLQAKEPLDCARGLTTYLSDRSRLDQVIAWLAYEEGNYDQALQGWTELKAGAGAAWSEEQEQFLKVFAAAKTSGRRLNLPGEPNYEPPS